MNDRVLKAIEVGSVFKIPEDFTQKEESYAKACIFFNRGKYEECLLEIIFLEITEALCRGENVEIRGFGTYKIVERKARVGRNPKNSESVQIPKKNAMKWKMSKTFFNQLNKSFTDKEISGTY